jgi:hypothetical protein
MLRAFQWDLARQVERLDHLLALFPLHAAWGYDRLYLHLEDAVDYPSLPGVARADAYTWEQLRHLVASATAHGIQVVPIANLLGHTQYLIKTPEWRDLNELRDPATGAALPVGQICPLHPRVPELVSRLFNDLAPLCTAGEIHAGLDESFHLGKHPLSRAEVSEIGLAAHFARHVTRLHAAAARHGLRLGLWADMLALLPEAIPLLASIPPSLPRQVGVGLNVSSSSAPGSSLPALSAYDWYYHPFDRHPRMELRNFADYDLAPALRAAGIAYWACPMNGAFRHEHAPVWTDRLQNLAAWWQRARDTDAAGYLVTSWEPHRLALPTNTLLSAAAATLWLDPSSPTDPATLLAAGLRRYTTSNQSVTKLVTPPAPRSSNSSAPLPAKCNQIGYTLPIAPARTLARRLLATDSLAFCGNSRWEINTAWTLVAGRRDGAVPHARAARQLARLAAATPPHFLTATLRFQAYLSHREVFVRQAFTSIARLRRHVAHPQKFSAVLAALTEASVVFATQLRAARADARRMWAASRPDATFAASPNAARLAADAARLRSLRAWIRSAARRPRHAFRASPVAGRWTLRFTVHHFAPCHQKLVVEQQQPDATWRELHARVLIEFRSAAARPRTPYLRFEFAVPIDAPDAPLRIASRCLGEFAVSHIELTDGVTTRVHRPLRTRHVLGAPAPSTGWPRIDWLTNTAELPLIFS